MKCVWRKNKERDCFNAQNGGKKFLKRFGIRIDDLTDRLGLGPRLQPAGGPPDIPRKPQVNKIEGNHRGGGSKGTGKYKIVNGFEAKVHPGKQGKHIPGHPNYQKGKSIFTGDAQKLLDECAGTGQKIGSNKERVDFKQIIGKWVDPNTGGAFNIAKGIIHYSKNGAHIVPARTIVREKK